MRILNMKIVRIFGANSGFSKVSVWDSAVYFGGIAV
jgi:hypothetical protein